MALTQQAQINTGDSLRAPELLAQLPRSQKLIKPLLLVLKEHGSSKSNSEIEAAVSERLKLPKEVASIPHVKDSRTELGYRLAWAQTYLKSVGALQNPKKGYWQITPLDKQKEIMLDWFHSRYEDPTTYAHSENRGIGYQYEWEELVRPIDVIMVEFEEKFDDRVIDEVITELTNRCSLWAPATEYDEYYAPQSTYCEVFKNSLIEIEKMAAIDITANDREILYRMLYARIYSALEVYLCDALIYSIREDANALKNFVTSYKSFAEQSIQMRDLFGLYDNIKPRVTDYLNKMVWHRFKDAEKVYKACYDISFSTVELEQLEEGLKLRHDIVHRDGKDIEGISIRSLNKADLMDLMNLARAFVEDVDNKLKTAQAVPA